MTHKEKTPFFADDEYEMRLLLERSRFKSGVQKIRKKWEIPSTGFVDNEAINEWRDRIEARIEDYRHDVEILLGELGLTKRWQQGVSYYIQNNLPGMLRVQSPNPLSFTYTGNIPVQSNIFTASIEVDATTTEREVTERLKEAKELLGVTNKKRQPLRNLGRDLEILQMQKDGMKNSDIARLINDRTGSVFNEDDIKVILKRMRRRLE